LRAGGLTIRIMRIIAGEHRGRKLVPPEGMRTTRPITDKVKETLFNKLFSLNLLPGEAGAQVADAFCGTGSLGIEALSRGAAGCVFIEQSRPALRGLRENLEAIGAGGQAQVIEGDGLLGTWLRAVPRGSLRVVFLDPPYELMRRVNTRQQIERLIAQAEPRLEPGGLVVLRGPAEDDAMPETVEALDGPMTDRFKHMAVHYYQKVPEE